MFDEFAFERRRSSAPLPAVSGAEIALTIGQVAVRVGGKASRAVGVNGAVPAPLVRLRDGQRVRLRVSNTLDEESSIHWHGLLVPFAMDGVPAVSFPGIMPRSTFDYEFDVVQSGTCWYHSHSAYQEEDGLYGPIVINPGSLTNSGDLGSLVSRCLALPERRIGRSVAWSASWRGVSVRLSARRISAHLPIGPCGRVQGGCRQHPQDPAGPAQRPTTPARPPMSEISWVA